VLRLHQASSLQQCDGAQRVASRLEGVGYEPEPFLVSFALRDIEDQLISIVRRPGDWNTVTRKHKRSNPRALLGVGVGSLA
jgi:hypothetical protein